MPKGKETPRLMKDGLGPAALDRLGNALSVAWPEFDMPGFARAARSGLDGLELKDRVRRIIRVMDDFLPEDYPRALRIVERAGGCFPAASHRSSATRTSSSDLRVPRWQDS